MSKSGEKKAGAARGGRLRNYFDSMVEKLCDDERQPERAAFLLNVSPFRVGGNKRG